MLLNKMNEKRKKKLLKKFMIKLFEKKGEIIRKYFGVWKKIIQIKNNNKDYINKEINISKTTNKKIITYIKIEKEKQIKNEIDEKEEEREPNNKVYIKKDSKSNLYVKHRPQTLNFVSSTKNNQDKKNNVIYTQPKLNDINSKSENISLKQEFPIKLKKNIINEKEKEKYIKEEIKTFTLQNPKKETTKEFSLIINPLQRKEEFDSIDLNLSSIKIPKIPQKKAKNKEINDYRFVRSKIRNNIGNNADLLSPSICRSNKRSIEIEKNDNNNNSLNNENLNNVKRKLIFEKEKAILSTGKEENNKDSIKDESITKNKILNYKKITYIPYKKIVKNMENNIKEDKNYRLKEKDKNYEISNKEEKSNIIRKYERKIFKNERKEVKIKSKTVIEEVEIELKNHEFNLENRCKKEYYKDKDYNNLILCEEIIYKSYEAVPEKLLNIIAIQKPVKNLKKNEKVKDNEKNVDEKESIFVQKIIKYKERERRNGNIFKSPIKSPLTPSRNELDIERLSPFSGNIRNSYKKKQRRINIISPEQSYKERRERKENELIEKKEKPKLITPTITEHEDLKKIIIIPNCPVSETINYIKDIRKSCLKSNIIENIDSYPIKENIPKIKVPDKRFYPKIYKSLKKSKKLTDFHIQFLRDIPHYSFKRLDPNKIYNIINDNNKILALIQIFYIYAHYKYDKYFIKLEYWNRWKKKIGIFNTSNNNYLTHLKNISGHCFSAEKIIIKEIRCGIHPDSNNLTDCMCLRTRLCLKRILLRHYLLKVINKKKYYLLIWYKKALKKIRAIYL